MRTAVIIDYQNVNTSGTRLFASAHENLEQEIFVNPNRFSKAVIARRNKLRRHLPKMQLSKIFISRGLPDPLLDPIEYAKNIEQKLRWESEVESSTTVQHRPLSYQFDSKPSISRKYSHRQEKGIDVMCAIAVLRNLQDPEIDAVILASVDSDLEPALEEGLRVYPGKIIETTSWFEPSKKGGRNQIGRKLNIWNTPLGEDVYRQVLDP